MKIDFFEKNLLLKIHQKGNQLAVQGNKKNIDILKGVIVDNYQKELTN